MSKSSKHILYAVAVASMLVGNVQHGQAQDLGTQLDSLPIITAKLVTVCAKGSQDPSLQPMKWLRAVIYRTDGMVFDHFAHKPGGVTPKPSGSDAFTTASVGLSLPGISRLGELAQIEFEFSETACVDAMYLLINERYYMEELGEIYVPLFPERRMGSPNAGRYRPGNARILTIGRQRIMDSAAQAGRSNVCALPLNFSGTTVYETITAVVGDALLRSGTAWFEPDDWLAVVRGGDSVIVEFTIHSTEGHTARLQFELGLYCAKTTPTEEDPEPNDFAISIDVSDISVIEVGGDTLTEIVDELGLAQGFVAAQINAQLAGVRQSLSNFVKHLLLCPDITFEPGDGSSAATAVVLGVPIYPSSLRIDGIPDLTLIGLPPASLCR